MPGAILGYYALLIHKPDSHTPLIRHYCSPAMSMGQHFAAGAQHVNGPPPPASISFVPHSVLDAAAGAPNIVSAGSAEDLQRELLSPGSTTGQYKQALPDIEARYGQAGRVPGEYQAASPNGPTSTSAARY